MHPTMDKIVFGALKGTNIEMSTSRQIGKSCVIEFPVRKG